MKPKMRSYLSFGGGVNSVAMLLLLLDEGWEFESVYVDHGCDWPETREYVKMMAEKYPITILRPEVKYKGKPFDNLYEFALLRRIIPLRQKRWCTRDFKVYTLNNYFKAPAFALIGISTEEDHRAKWGCANGIESRFPLLEYEISRTDCTQIIKAHGLPVPMKSGCWFCPFQGRKQWKQLRRMHPELFCMAKKLEDTQNERKREQGKPSGYINDYPLEALVSEKQSVMWPEMKPPCSCGL